MISQGGFIEKDTLILKTLGITEEEFYSLPMEYQQVFLMYSWHLRRSHDEFDNFKTIILKNNDNIGNKVKRKVLSVLKKK